MHVRSPVDLDRWLASQTTADLAEAFTFVVDLNAGFWLAPRRGQHVACAGGTDVLAAGEIGFTYVQDEWINVSNQSTSHCLEPESWQAVARSVDGAGIRHPNRFTRLVIFRRCKACGERNLVRVFVCALCDSTLPDHWNFDE
jgi:hypothetical protein